MNILLPLSWFKEYFDAKVEPKDLVEQLSLHSMSVEKILAENELLNEHVVLAEITEVGPHPNADKLFLTKVFDGAQTHQVVCGGKNLKEGMKIALAKPGAVVKWHGEGDPVVLQEAKIRGEKSFGMICDKAEIGLASEPDPNTFIADYSNLDAPVGTPLAQALGMDDLIFDIEITTNRVDAASIIGMAREAGAIYGKGFTNPEFSIDETVKGEVLPLEVEIKDDEKCLGFNAVVLSGVKVAPSPEWLQRRLRAVGHTPINNVVDITNYVMRELGQPMHAFDYTAVKNGKLIIREAKKKEELETLDGVKMNLDPSMVVVADKNGALSVGGVKGGASSMISDQTTTVLLECASWNPLTIRRTMQKLDLFSDAGMYFAKGVSPEQAIEALRRAIQLFQEICGAQIASPIVSEGYKSYTPAEVTMRFEQAEKYVGAKLDRSKVFDQLHHLGFGMKNHNDDHITVLVPHWRQYDVTIEEDLIEEVARLYGYQNIKDVLPSGEMPVPQVNKHLIWEGHLKNLLKGLGCTEVYTYSMVSEALLELSGRHQKEAIRILNPLDDDHVVMRTRLLPSVLEVVAMNQGVIDQQLLFEITNVYIPQKKQMLPSEQTELVVAMTTTNLEQGFRELKGITEELLKTLGFAQQILFEAKGDFDLTDGKASLTVLVDGKDYGCLGVVNNKTMKAVGLKSATVALELDLHALIEMAHPHLAFTPIPKYPEVELDLSVLVDQQVAWQEVLEVCQKQGGALLKSIELFDVYSPGDGKKSFAFHLRYRADDRTLEMKEIEPIQQKIIAALEKQLKASLRA